MARRAASADDRAARAAVAAEALRAVVERGAPYTAELATVKSLGADQTALAALEPFAAGGVPTATELAHELSQLTPSLQQASGAPSSGGSFLGRLENNAKKLVRITPVDAPAGEEPSAVVARLDADAARADIAAALADIARLPQSAKTLAEPWVAKANARAAAIAASRRIAADALAGARQHQHAMIRVVSFLIIVGALSLAVAWLADRPGDVVITWQGLRIETSLMVLGAAMLALMALLASDLEPRPRDPALAVRAARTLLRNRRGVRAYEAISNGLIAVGSGDVGAARKLSAEVNRIAPGEPLALLLTAQSAQLAGDREGAERAFRAMASRADTKALGLHGLFVEAQRRDDLASARAYAEEAARTAPSLGWAGRAVLEFRCATGDWAGALAHARAQQGRARQGSAIAASAR